ncbi:MAG: TRAP transporter large permease [Desulfobacterota bacterium]|nr:TRAP transporter large permease [Thermodesulfobacteriota bacterium]MDW8001637.1 TRAP transporter large permease [Deltaproteobacteria bacterium]
MSPETVGIIGIGVLVLFFVIRMPIAFSMAFVGFLGFSYVTSLKTGLAILPRNIFEQLTSYSISAIPMFILMGYYAFSAGLGSRLYDAAYKVFGHIRGGLAIASIFACAAFGAICGSSTATAATMGKLALPAMKKYGYNDTLATGCIAAAGSLGILIPPSVIFLIYGFMTEQSIGKLFISGILPGILLAILMSVAVIIICYKNPTYGPKGERSTLKEKVIACLRIMDAVGLFILVVGGLLFGFFTPTQAGGIGAAGALVLGLLRREVTWDSFVQNTREALRTSCMILTIIACATVFGKFVTISKLPLLISNWVSSLEVPPFVIMLVIIAIYLVGGCFIDAIPLIILTIPILYPIVLNLGYDPIWFGVIIVLVTCMGVVTPPVGVNVYVIKGIAKDVPLEQIFKGIFPFLIAMIVASIILLFYPPIATFLPSFVK